MLFGYESELLTPEEARKGIFYLFIYLAHF